MSLLRTVRISAAMANKNQASTRFLTPAIARTFTSSIAQQKQAATKEDVIKHAPGWKHENASDSEASVKADREPHPQNLSHLQKESIETLQKKGENVVDRLKDKAEDLGTHLGTKAGKVEYRADQGKEYLKKGGEKVKEEAEEAVEDVKGFAQGAKKRAEGVKDQVEDGGETVMEGVKAGAQKVVEAVKDSAKVVKETIVGKEK